MLISNNPQTSVFKLMKQESRSNKIPFAKPNRDPEENSCLKFNPNDIKITAAQYIFYKIVKEIAENKTDLKGLLAWYSTGAGKTAVAAGVVDAFWNTDYKIYYISRSDALKPHEDFELLLRNMYKNPKTMFELKRKFKIMSIVSFYNRVIKKEINLDKAVIVIDEAQYLFAKRAIPQFRVKHERLIKMLQKSENYRTKVFILTATPGDSIEEMIELLNIIRKKTEPILTLNNYQKYMTSKVLYLDMTKDLSLFPKKRFKEHVVELSEEQKTRYSEKLKELKAKLATNNKKALQTLQKWSNGLFKNIRQPPKVKRILEKIDSYPNRKHYVYSQYSRQGIKDVEAGLIAKGYQRATNNNISKPGKRYLLAKASERFITSESANPIFKMYNSKQNDKGDYISIFLATDSYNTGIDLKGVRHLHFMEPPLSYVDVIQGVGRGVRMCSHKNFDKKDWIVKVHTYIGIIKKESENNSFMNSIDKFVLNKANKDRDEFENKTNIFKNASIDCKALYHFHNQGNDSGLSCTEGNPYHSPFAKTRLKINLFH